MTFQDSMSQQTFNFRVCIVTKLGSDQRLSRNSNSLYF